MDFLAPTRKWWVLIGIGIGAMMVGIDFTIVNTVLSTIQKSLGATQSDLQWFMAAFGISFATLLTVLGRLGDILGRRLMIYCGMVGFLLASIGAGISWVSWQLIVFRFFQGVFGAAIFPCGMALTAENFPEKERGKAIGIYSGLIGIGFAIGPVLGGFIVTFLSWRWVFFINIPVIILSFLIALPTVKESKKVKDETIDWWGMFTFILGFGALIFAITEGPNFGWGTPLIIISFILAVLLVIAFVFIELHTAMPICPFPLFLNRGFFLGTVCFIASIAGSWPILFLLPLYLQNVLGFSPGEAGLILLSMTIMTIIAPPVTGHLHDKKGAIPTVLILFAAIIISYILQLFLSVDGPIWLIIVAFIFFGWGWGTGNGIGTPLALSHLPSTENAGIVSGAAITILNVVSVLFLSIIGTVFRYGENSYLHDRLTQSGIQLTPSEEGYVHQLLSDPEQAKSILSHFGRERAEAIFSFFKEAFVSGLHIALWILLIFTVLLFLAILKPLSKEKKNS